MRERETDRCDDCGLDLRVTRAWYRHYRTGEVVYPVRAGVISFCLNRDCPSNREDRRVA